MIRASKKQISDDSTTSATIDNENSQAEVEVVPEEVKQSTSTRRRNIILGTILYLLAALGIASHYSTTGYNETLPLRYKQYGSASKPCIVVIPGLDGATSFFNVRSSDISCKTNQIDYWMRFES